MRTLENFNRNGDLPITAGIFNAKLIAAEAHGSQMYGDLPYTEHLLDVFAYGNHIWENWDDTCSQAAFLHDIIEDTPTTEDDLREMGFSEEVIAIVVLVTKRKNLDYFENIQYIIDSENVRAMMVKAADNLANLRGDKSHWDETRAMKSNAKYQASFEVLVEAATNLGAK